MRETSTPHERNLNTPCKNEGLLDRGQVQAACGTHPHGPMQEEEMGKRSTHDAPVHTGVIACHTWRARECLPHMEGT